MECLLSFVSLFSKRKCISHQNDKSFWLIRCILSLFLFSFPTKDKDTIFHFSSFLSLICFDGVECRGTASKSSRIWKILAISSRLSQKMTNEISSKEFSRFIFSFYLLSLFSPFLSFFLDSFHFVINTFH